MRWGAFIIFAACAAVRGGGGGGEKGGQAPVHWAFVAPAPAPVPAVDSERGLVNNPIDAFIQARLARQGIPPSPEADRETLLRRVYLDFTGLPPVRAEVEAFLGDERPGAYDRLVDRLLAVPAYGERQARGWLDLARYADSNGYSIDSPRSIWPYRDWVVRALNADMPFDRFSVWQLAGDLVPAAEIPAGTEVRDPLIATGFHRNTQVNHEGGIDPEQFRIESIVDRINTTASVWLGLSAGCAQCHDHKYDPWTLREYYEVFAYFNHDENDGHGNAALQAEQVLELAAPEELERRDALVRQRKEAEKSLSEWAEKELRPRQAEWEQSLTDEARARLTPLVRDVLAIPPGQRNKDQAVLLWARFRETSEEWKRRQAEIDRLRKGEPIFPSTLVMRRRSEPRTTVTLIKGDFTRPGERVEAGTPRALHPRRAGDVASGSRLALARWLVDPRNPLVARVTVNRVWQQLLGRGLVETENDFGTQGTPPSHPELLDWLACEFMRGSGDRPGVVGGGGCDSAWSLKHLLRLIVTSHTYRQSSVARPEWEGRDPRNVLLARQNRIRLDAEGIRDVALVASGVLDSRIGGAPVRPPQPAGLEAFTQNDREWKVSPGGDRYRRGLYTWRQRTIMFPAFTVFDAPDASTACTRRNRSNTPLQSLTLLNDPAYHELSLRLGAELMRVAGADRDRLIEGYLRCVGRIPTSAETSRLEKFLATERASGIGGAAAWISVARILLNLDETITRE